MMVDQKNWVTCPIHALVCLALVVRSVEGFIFPVLATQKNGEKAINKYKDASSHYTIAYPIADPSTEHEGMLETVLTQHQPRLSVGATSHSNRAGVLTLCSWTPNVGRVLGEQRANLDANGGRRTVRVYEGNTFEGDSRVARMLSNWDDVWFGGIGPFVEDCIPDQEERRKFFVLNDLIMTPIHCYINKQSRLQSLMTLILVRWYPDLKQKYGEADRVTKATEAFAIQSGISLATLEDWANNIKEHVMSINELGLPVTADQPFGMALHQVRP
jgi:hypothetical protein